MAISFHPDQANIGQKEKYSFGFRHAHIDDPNRIAKALCNFVVSPILFKDGYNSYGYFRHNYRHTSCFLSSNWIGLDFDEGLSLDEGVNLFCDVTHVICTTKSHQVEKGKSPPCDRFRVFLKLPETITDPTEYKDIVRFYVERYEADAKCVDAARFFWPCKEVVSVFCGDVDETIEIKKKCVENTVNFDVSAYRTAKAIPPWIKHWLEFGVPAGQKNTTCLKIGIWLTKCGFSHEEIVKLIMNSPIPDRHDRVEKEVYKKSLNGVRIAIEEMKNPQVLEETMGARKSLATNKGTS